MVKLYVHDHVYSFLKNKKKTKSFYFCSSLANSPLIDGESDVDTAYSLNRRSSTGVLLSPEVELMGTVSKRLGDTLESDGFYLLKKDSQRRATLSKVLSHDEAKICNVWLEKIENHHNVRVAISKVQVI